VASRPLGQSGSRAKARPLIRQVGPGQARFGCFHDCFLSENNYFDQLNFTLDCHDYIAVTHNRNCNRSSIPSTSSADVCTHRPTRLFQNHHVTFTSLTLLSANTVIFCLRNVHNTLQQLQCGSMPNLMAARPNIGGALCESSIIPFLVPRRDVWLTPAAGVPCSNTANTGERKTWTYSE